MVVQLVGSPQFQSAVNAVYTVQHVIDECALYAVVITVTLHLVVEIGLENTDTSSQLGHGEYIVEVGAEDASALHVVDCAVGDTG